MPLVAIILLLFWNSESLIWGNGGQMEEFFFYNFFSWISSPFWMIGRCGAVVSMLYCATGVYSQP
jgi:hypothetical protein